MKKKVLLSILIIAVIIVAAVLSLNTKAMLSVVEKDSSITGSAHVVYIERMAKSESDIDVRAVSTDNEYYDELEKCIKDTRVGNSKNEAGTTFDEEVYTLTFRGDDEESGTINVSVNDKGQVHFNSSEKTYSIKGESDLFECVAKTFDAVK